MNLILKKEIWSLFKKYQIRPSKQLGQNFLIDKGVIEKIIESADLKPKDIVLEIGPGSGVLTQALAKKVKRVVAVEKDPNLARILNNELRIMDIKNVEIVRGDILKLDPKPYTLKSYKIVANLPFYLTAPMIRKSLEAAVQPKLMVLVVQKEVAQRICSKLPDMSILAVSVQFYAKPKIISYISKKCFWPSPKVDGAIIKLKVKSQKSKVNKNLFFRIVRAGFSQPRKQLINNLANDLKIDKIKVEKWLLKNNIKPIQRAETLNMKSWIKLARGFSSILSMQDVRHQTPS